MNDLAKMISEARYKRLLSAVGSDDRAERLFLLDNRLSQELNGLLRIFEFSFRNAINDHYCHQLGDQWLKDSIIKDGCFTQAKTRTTKIMIEDAICKCATKEEKEIHNYDSKNILQFMLNKSDVCDNNSILTKLSLGFWRYLFAKTQFNVCGGTLLNIFNHPPTKFNSQYLFDEALEHIVNARNRIAHLEPICIRKEKHMYIPTGENGKKCYEYIDEVLGYLPYGNSYSKFNSSSKNILAICEDIDYLYKSCYFPKKSTTT